MLDELKSRMLDELRDRMLVGLRDRMLVEPVETSCSHTPQGYSDRMDHDHDHGCGDSCEAPGHQHGYLANKDAYLKRLRRVEGQVRGIARMVEDEEYCIDILTQVSAATKALQSVALGLLDEHMGSCVLDAARQGGDEAQAKLAEASSAIARLVRS